MRLRSSLRKTSQSSRSAIGDIVCVLLGCEAPMLLRPQLYGKYAIVGECCVHGLHDGASLLGPLPHPWRVQVFEDSTGSLCIYRYFNADTGELSDEDPRLDPLPEEWEKLEIERTADDPGIFKNFRNKITGEIMNADPRLLPEALKTRGVDMQTFTLI